MSIPNVSHKQHNKQQCFKQHHKHTQSSRLKFWLS